MSLYVVILLQVLVPQDHAGLVPGARLEELHELCGEGGPVLVPGAVDDVRHHVMPVLSGNLKTLIPVNMTMLLIGLQKASDWLTADTHHVCCPLIRVCESGVCPRLDQEQRHL